MTFGQKILGVVWLLLCLQVWAGAPSASTTEARVIEVTDSLDRKTNEDILYFLDETNDVAIGDVIGKAQSWAVPESANLTFGLETTTAWVKAQFLNDEKLPRTVFFEFNPVFLEQIHAYDESGKLLDSVGSTLPMKRFESVPALKFEVPPGKSTRYFSVRSRSNSLATAARSLPMHEVKTDFDLAVFCTLIGGLLLLMVYHIFLFVTYPNRTYLFYSLFLASTIHFTVSFSSYHKGILPDVIFGFHTDFWWSALSAPILLFFIYLFSAALLDLFPKKPYFSGKDRLKSLLLILPVMDVLTIITVFATNSAYALIPVRFFALIHMLVLPSVGVVLWTRNRSNNISLYYALSWIPFTLGAFLIVAWLSGALDHSYIYSWGLPIGTLCQSLLLAFAAGQQLNVVTQDKLKEQRDKLRVMDELENKVTNLKRRDQVIRSFVSIDVVEELDRGEDPLQYQPRNLNKSITFMDMHNYTTFFETYSAFECQKTINEFFKIVNDAVYAERGRVDKIIGDAMMIEFSDPTSCLKAIVETRKNLSAANRERFEQHKELLQFGTGISHGTMLSANFGSNHKIDRTLIGDPVNVASRLETITRQFSVDILCSKEFIDLQHDYQFYRPAGYVMLKGRAKKSLVYEIFEHHPPAVIEWKLSTRGKIMEAIKLELAGKFHEALAAIQSLIQICPPHTLHPDMPMDPTLNAMVHAIEEKMRQLEMKVPSQEELSPLLEQYRKAG
ncbi:MAG: 7TM diverse intracellular signaling domain-containing protein [Bdellovibrionota bacterium]